MVDTDTGPRGELRGTRCIAPGMLELLSYPLPSFLAASPSQQQLGGAGAEAAQRAQRAAAQRQQYGVRLRLAGSGWTPPLALDAADLSPGAAAGGDAAAAAQQQVHSKWSHCWELCFVAVQLACVHARPALLPTACLAPAPRPRPILRRRLTACRARGRWWCARAPATAWRCTNW